LTPISPLLAGLAQHIKAHYGAQWFTTESKFAKNDPKRLCYVRSMLTTEIQQDTHTGPVTLNPRWLRIPSAVKYSGLSRSRLYELLAQGRIKSICVKSHNDALRGVRLVDRESIDLFMESLHEVVPRI
jgi:hypothetical protein